MSDIVKGGEGITIRDEPGAGLTVSQLPGGGFEFRIWNGTRTVAARLDDRHAALLWNWLSRHTETA